MDGTLAWISVAPVKGLGLAALERAEVGPGGVAENRRFHVLDERGRLVNGKVAGSLVQVAPSWSQATGVLALTFPDGTRVEDEVRLGEAVDGMFFGYPRPGRIVAGEFAAALSEHAGRAVRLVQSAVGVAVDRGPDAAISLLSVAAVDGFDPRRFRMTFGIAGVPAHAEDGWLGRDVSIGGAVVRPLGVTGRCLVTSQNPDTGVADMDMLEHLRLTRPQLLGEPLPFGVHGAVVRPGPVAVGDRVAVPAR